MNPYRNRKPILDAADLLGRDAELRALEELIAARPPQCCSVVGEARSGKTSLLYTLAARGGSAYAYVNAGPYADLGAYGAHGSLYFWRDVAKALGQAIPGAPDLPLPDVGAGDAAVLDAVYALRDGVEQLVRSYAGRVVLLLDNVEGLARLPAHNSRFLRSLIQDPALAGRVAYVATSRAPLTRLFPQDGWQEPSSLWSLFGSTVYLGLVPMAAAHRLVTRANGSGPQLDEEDAAFVLRLAGRHPELINITCAHLYDRYVAGAVRGRRTYAEAARQTQAEAEALCALWWGGLPATHPAAQQALADLALGRAGDESALEELERRGMVEREGRQRRVFAEVMQAFVLRRAAGAVAADGAAAPESAAAPDPAPLEGDCAPAFTHLEAEVYEFLRAHAGTVCDREAIKRAVWHDAPPSDSALQKIIERIREKIEPDPKNPRRLIAVRGQGYILRSEP